MKTARVGLGVLATVVPVALAYANARNRGLVAVCDDVVVRTLGHGYTGTLPRNRWDPRAGAWGIRLQLRSLGRLQGLFASLVYVLGERISAAPRNLLAAITAVIAAMTAALTLPAQQEATLLFGSLLGASFVLASLVELPGWMLFATLGLACTYDVTAGLAALLAVGVRWSLERRVPRWKDAAWLTLGVVPVLWMGVAASASAPRCTQCRRYSGWLGEGTFGQVVVGWSQVSSRDARGRCSVAWCARRLGIAAGADGTFRCRGNRCRDRRRRRNRRARRANRTRTIRSRCLGFARGSVGIRGGRDERSRARRGRGSRAAGSRERGDGARARARHSSQRSRARRSWLYPRSAT